MHGISLMGTRRRRRRWPHSGAAWGLRPRRAEATFRTCVRERSATRFLLTSVTVNRLTRAARPAVVAARPWFLAGTGVARPFVAGGSKRYLSRVEESWLIV